MKVTIEVSQAMSSLTPPRLWYWYVSIDSHLHHLDDTGHATQAEAMFAAAEHGTAIAKQLLIGHAQHG